MKLAIIGGTHGNEPCGVEVIKFLEKSKPQGCVHSYKTFLGNPKAFELKKRYVDADLNRAFGKNGVREGYEKTRAVELEEQIGGQFDFAIDLHTTTTNMGSTLLLNNTNPLSRQVVGYLQAKYPEIRIVEEKRLDDETPHLNHLSPAGVTIEIGAVANNVLSADIIFKTYSLVKAILCCPDFSTIDFSQTEYFKEIKSIPYPQQKGWYIHPEFEGTDFKELKPGAPLFINLNQEVITFDGPKTVYPFFINEAAYIEKNIATIIASLRKGFK